MGFPTILMFVVMLGLIWFMQRQQKKTSARTPKSVKRY